MTDTDYAARRFTVRGIVQGVGFRWFVRETAVRLGVSGWVANTADGSVTGEVAGETAAVEELMKAIAVGPPAARVADLQIRTEAVTVAPASGFEIRR